MRASLPKQAIILTILLGLILLGTSIDYLRAPTAEATITVDSTVKLNINTATAAELMLLPGIGEQRAAAIIEYRRQQGAFDSPAQLVNINGINENTLKNIEDFIYAK